MTQMGHDTQAEDSSGSGTGSGAARAGAVTTESLRLPLPPRAGPVRLGAPTTTATTPPDRRTLSQLLARLGTDLDSAYEELPVALYVIDRDGVICWLNRAGIELFGNTVGRNVRLVVAPEDVHRSRKELARKLIGEASSTEFQLSIVRDDGERIHVDLASVPLHAKGAAVAVFGAARPARKSSSPPLAGDAPPLTPRQHEVLHLLAEGLTTAEVAARLNVAEETARNHIRALLRQLQAHTRLQAVVEALRNGWI